MRRCITLNCSKKHYAKGYCRVHYNLLLKRATCEVIYDLPGEVWKPVAGYEGIYQVSSLGRVKSSKRSGTPTRIRKPARQKTGYMTLDLWKEGKCTHFLLHRVIASAFVKNLDNKREVNHKNCIKHDNRASNLEWVSPKENMQHARDSNRINPLKGEEHPNAKLTANLVRQIRTLYDTGEYTKAALSRAFHVSHQNIAFIVSKQSWSHI